VAINNYQTLDERINKQTKHENGMGFTSFDASIGTSMAEFYLKNNFLSSKQVAFWRKPDKNGRMRIEKYANQLVKIAEDKQSYPKIIVP
jgi:hypothetical protein